MPNGVRPGVRKLLVIILLLQAGVAGGETRVAEEYTLKAAYLYNFAKFVQWPEGAKAEGDPIRVCVLGEDPFGAGLDKIRGRKAQNREITVARMSDLPKGAPPACDILFVTESEARAVDNLVASLADYPILTVSDTEEFVQRGGMIGFRNIEQRIKFEINIAASDRARLTISSFLLQLALAVHGREDRED